MIVMASIQGKQSSQLSPKLKQIYFYAYDENTGLESHFQKLAMLSQQKKMWGLFCCPRFHLETKKLIHLMFPIDWTFLRLECWGKLFWKGDMTFGRYPGTREEWFWQHMELSTHVRRKMELILTTSCGFVYPRNASIIYDSNFHLATQLRAQQRSCFSRITQGQDFYLHKLISWKRNISSLPPTLSVLQFIYLVVF